MTVQRRWKGSALFLLILFLDGWIAPSARAQIFDPLWPTPEAQSQTGRFTLEAYAAQWQNPFRITIATVSPQMNFQVARRTVRVVANTPPSPLLEASYALDRHWSVGAWYNPLRGERIKKGVQVVDVSVTLNFERNTDLADFHITYHGPRGLSAQLGYYRESGTYRDLTQPSTASVDYTQVSWNFWATQRLDVRSHGRDIAPFVSAGYHPASGLDYAVSILIGVGVTLNQRISLSGSVWLFDLSNPATRVTGGVVIRI